MAEKLFQAHLENLQVILADASRNAEYRTQEFQKAKREYKYALDAYNISFLSQRESLFKILLDEKKEELAKARDNYGKAIKCLKAVQILLETEVS